MTKTSTALTAAQKKAYRAIGHRLEPVVMVGEKGISEGLLLELERALDDHELIKVKIAAGDREAKAELIKELLTKSRSLLVQKIGNIALILRLNPNGSAKLSNISKYQY